MPPHKVTTPADCYDQSLHYARDRQVPEELRPHFTRDWLPENIALLERYVAWLLSGGTSPHTTRLIYLPMAGHILGLNLKPHTQLDLQVDLQKAMDYVRAKQQSVEWTKLARIALLKFRHFLLQERKLADIEPDPPKFIPPTTGLPAWLVEQLTRYQHIRQVNWRPARMNGSLARFWCLQLHVWRFLCDHCGVSQLEDVRRQHLFDYLDYRLAARISVSTINSEIREFHSFLGYLQEQGLSVPRALLHFPCLNQPDALPKFLADEQVLLLNREFERQVREARGFVARRDALWERAAFLLLWQSAMRLGEVEELRLEDLDLPGRKLTVRQGKGMKDRVVFLTDATCRALMEYLPVRGAGVTDHVFLYRNRALRKDLIHSRIKAAGDRVGVKVSPHQLRHTCATQLLNAGCRVTSIQKLLGHTRLNSTMIYARVHDRTVANDYYAAMQEVEQRLLLLEAPLPAKLPVSADERHVLLELADQLSAPHLNEELRLELVFQLRQTLRFEALLERAPPA